MKLQVITAMFAASAASAMLSAQAPQTPAPQTPAPQTQSTTTRQSASDATVTLQGCLQRSSASATPGATGTSGGSSFVLNNAMRAAGSSPQISPPASLPDSSPSIPNAAGTSGSAIGTSYRLDAEDSQVSAHVGHKVEIVGTLDEESLTHVMPTPNSSPSTASSAQAPAMPRLKVESVKMLATTCP